MFWDPDPLRFVGGVGFERHVDVQNRPWLDCTIGLPPRIDVRIRLGLDYSIDLLLLRNRPGSRYIEGFLLQHHHHHHHCQRY